MNMYVLRMYMYVVKTEVHFVLLCSIHILLYAYSYMYIFLK